MDTKNFTELEVMATDWEKEAAVLKTSNVEALRTAASIYEACAKSLKHQAQAYKRSVAQKKSSPKGKEEKSLRAIGDLFGEEDEVILTRDDYTELTGQKPGKKDS